MVKRLSIVMVCAVLSVSAVVLALRPFRPGPAVTREHFERLRPGMTRAEVERLLGGPPRNGLRHRAIVWLPQAAGRPISTEIAPAAPAVEIFVREDRPKNARPPARSSALDFFPGDTAKDGEQAVWVSKASLIAVYYGPDGRLRHRYESTVHETGPPSVTDWLASRPRMIRRSLGF